MKEIKESEKRAFQGQDVDDICSATNLLKGKYLASVAYKKAFLFRKCEMLTLKCTGLAS